MQRRKFLTLVGGGTILAATGGATAFALTRTPTKALAPWGKAGQYDDPRLRALSYAILAPNPHNLQPWKVALSGTDGVHLFFDQDRQLPHTDPYDRQLTIGLGCFLEMMRMAAASEGYEVRMDLFPNGYATDSLDERPVATVQFAQANQASDPLWDYALQRRSTKEPFDTSRPVSQADLAKIVAASRTASAGGTVDPTEIAHWRNVTAEALRIELTTPRTLKESVDVFRIGKQEINANPDGIDFGGVMFESLSAVGLFSREAALDTQSMSFQGGLDATSANAMSAMGFLWLTTKENTRLDQLATGADWLRMNLACTALGIGFHPMSQALQEYPEMAALYQDTHARLSPNGGTVQMLTRIGYGPTVPASPRWPIDNKLVNV